MKDLTIEEVFKKVDEMIKGKCSSEKRCERYCNNEQ